MSLFSRFAVVSLSLPLLVFSGCVRAMPSASDSSPSLETAEAIPGEDVPEETFEVAADVEDKVTKVKVTTDIGSFVIDVHSGWAPNGAAHWLKLVKEGYYNDTRFFRVVPGFMAQTGISGDPKMNSKWGEATIRDDKVRASNKRGYVTFAQTGAPNSRSTQWFINFGDNSFLDTSGQGFMPFGKIVEGMSVVDKINDQYGENPRGENVQGRAKDEGNAFLDKRFPGLTKIVKIEVIDDGSSAESSTGEGSTSEKSSSGNDGEQEADSPEADADASTSPEN